MEKGIPLPEIPQDCEQRPWFHNRERDALGNLTGGIFMIMLGVGTVGAFKMSEMPELNRVWTLGFVPVFLGFGLILNYIVLRIAGK